MHDNTNQIFCFCSLLICTELVTIIQLMLEAPEIPPPPAAAPEKRLLTRTETKYNLEVLREKAEELENEGLVKVHTRETDVLRRYAYQIWQRGDSKYEMQFATNPDNPEDHMEIPTIFLGKLEPEKGAGKEKYGILARIWRTNEDTEDGPVATCYKLLKGADGREFWVMQTSSEVTTADGVNTWKMEDSFSFVDDNQISQEIAAIYQVGLAAKEKEEASSPGSL